MSKSNPPVGAFDGYKKKLYPFEFTGSLYIPVLVGGTPSDPEIIEAWIRTKTQNKDEMLREAVAKTMEERGCTLEEAESEVAKQMRNLNGFKRDPEHGLYIEGRQLKSGIREAASIAAATGNLPNRGWGKTNAGVQKWAREHIFVVEERLYLSRYETDEPIRVADGVAQRFIPKWNVTGIQYEEYVKDVTVNFTVVSDHKFSEEEWAAIWITGQHQGLGASRSQGFGTYTVTEWTKAA